jgi:uroporphyrinogen-III decarboxylase
MPKGKVYWAMGYGTDFRRAKSILDGIACITGNVHAALLHQGSVQEVEDYCKELIAVAGKGGGYIFGTSSIDRNAKPANVRAMVAAAKKYGLSS